MTDLERKDSLIKDLKLDVEMLLCIIYDLCGEKAQKFIKIFDDIASDYVDDTLVDYLVQAGVSEGIARDEVNYYFYGTSTPDKEE